MDMVAHVTQTFIPHIHGAITWNLALIMGVILENFENDQMQRQKLMMDV